MTIFYWWLKQYLRIKHRSSKGLNIRLFIFDPISLWFSIIIYYWISLTGYFSPFPNKSNSMIKCLKILHIWHESWPSSSINSYLCFSQTTLKELASRYSDQSIIFRHQRLGNCDLYDFLSISKWTVDRIGPCSPLLIWEIDEPIRVSRNPDLMDD